MNSDTEKSVPLLDATAIADAFGRVDSSSCNVQVLETVASTNTWLLEHLRTVARVEGALVCAAENQTAGRGRRGKTWHTPAQSVTFSIALTVPLPLPRVSGLSLVAGAAVCDCLRNFGAGPAMVKWPNDILVNDAKLCGILVEIAHHSTHSTTVVIGLGVNYRRGPEVTYIEQASIDLFQLCDGNPLDRSLLIGSLAATVFQCTGSMSEASLPRFVAAWGHYDALKNRQVDVDINSSQKIVGEACGIDKNGHLQVRVDGTVRCFSSADVSIRRAS